MEDSVCSPIKLDDFELLPDTPISMQSARLSIDEFTEAKPLLRRFCDQLSVHEYEHQAEEATGSALNELIAYMDNHPEEFAKILRKRKKDELETSGLTSFLKFRFMSKLQGDKYTKNLVSGTECQERQQEVKDGILKAYSYAQESKERRYNTRLAARQASMLRLNQSSTISDPKISRQSASTSSVSKNTGSAPIPPPPPSYPAPQLHIDKKKRSHHPLTDRTNVVSSTPCLQRPNMKTSKDRKGSRVSMISVNDELLAMNPLKRLKATNGPRSPGGTPVKIRRTTRNSALHEIDSSNSSNSKCPETPGGHLKCPETPGSLLNTSESLTSIFMRIMDEKFKHVRSPPSPSSSQRADDSHASSTLDVSNDFS